jgi:hypothetical protein
MSTYLTPIHQNNTVCLTSDQRTSWAAPNEPLQGLTTSAEGFHRTGVKAAKCDPVGRPRELLHYYM